MKRIITIFLCIVTVSLSCDEHAWAAENLTPLQSSLKMLWGLGIVFAILFIVYLLSKKFIPQFQPHSTGIIKVVDRRYIGPKNALVVVEIRGHEYLVGTSNDTISTIVPLPIHSPLPKISSESEQD